MTGAQEAEKGEQERGSGEVEAVEGHDLVQGEKEGGVGSGLESAADLSV